jgi:hypothetical protein
MGKSYGSYAYGAPLLVRVTIEVHRPARETRGLSTVHRLLRAVVQNA